MEIPVMRRNVHVPAFARGFAVIVLCLSRVSLVLCLSYVSLVLLGSSAAYGQAGEPVASVVAPEGSPAEAVSSRPNILFLFADDQCWETLGVLGQTDIETPNLDRLARRGMLFTRAYNMGSWSGAVCVASRTMLITGRSVWDAQRIYHQTDDEREAGVLWPQLMSGAGYRTYFSGKWHIQADVKKCFDVVGHVRAGMPETVPQAYDRPRAGQPDNWRPDDRSLGGFWAGGKHWSEVVADDAAVFMKDAGEHRQPFFMYLAFNAPHDPRQSPRAYLDKYPLERIALPENFLPVYPHHVAIGCGPDLRDERLAPFPRTPEAVKVHRQEYYALITHMDHQIGAILEALEATGQADRTLIFFTADHGLAVGHHGLFGKQNMYEHSTRVPFIVAGPGVPLGERNSAPIYLQDVMATALDVAGAERPGHLYFQSLLPLLRSEQQRSQYAEIYGAYLELQRSITVGDWKLIAYPKEPKLRMYRLTDDPLEMHDLADSAEHVQVRNELLARLFVQQRELQDKLDLTSIFPLPR
jgi:arylsulfatase A-like enzyme